MILYYEISSVLIYFINSFYYFISEIISIDGEKERSVAFGISVYTTSIKTFKYSSIFISKFGDFVKTSPLH